MPSALLILVLAAGWRVFTLYVPALSNFSPVMALAFCAGVYTRNRWMWLAPFAALVVSDLYIDHYYAAVYHYQWGSAARRSGSLCFVAAVGIGVAVSAGATGSTSSAGRSPDPSSSTS